MKVKIFNKSKSSRLIAQVVAGNSFRQLCWDGRPIRHVF